MDMLKSSLIYLFFIYWKICCHSIEIGMEDNKVRVQEWKKPKVLGFF